MWLKYLVSACGAQVDFFEQGTDGITGCTYEELVSAGINCVGRDIERLETIKRCMGDLCS
jgi:hypothetical protein